MKRVTIITACYNAEKYIAETIQSVLNQTAFLSKRAELEYYIIDGKSTDGTLSIIENSIRDFDGGKIHIISEKDIGLYDALTKGFKLATGEICAYINAGDYYSSHAIDIVLDVFENERVKWLTGLCVIYNSNSQFVGAALPFKYRKSFFAKGIYNGKILPPVQQESTFWRTILNKHIDYDKFSKMKLAGDYYLWFEFSKVTDLNIVEAYLGGFKFHKGHLGEDTLQYSREVDSIVEKSLYKNILLTIIDKALWYAPGRIKKCFNKKHLYRFDHKTQKWV